MKTIVKLYPLLITVIFVGSCFLSSKLSLPYLTELQTVSITESSSLSDKQTARILVVNSDDINEVYFDKLDEYKKEHPNYSFLIPLERENYFKDKIRENVSQKINTNHASFKASQITENKQFIEYSMDGSRRSYDTKYIASEKNISLITVTTIDSKTAFGMFLIGIVTAIICSLVFVFLFKKYIKPKAEME